MPSPAPRRRRLEAGDRRAAIVQTATGLIAERGYRGLTVQSLSSFPLTAVQPCRPGVCCCITGAFRPGPGHTSW